MSKKHKETNMQQEHPISREPAPFTMSTVAPGKLGGGTGRLQDACDVACCAAFALLSLAVTAWLWHGIIALPALR